MPKQDSSKKDGASVEIIMKDISMVRNVPRRLWEWARIAIVVAEKDVA